VEIVPFLWIIAPTLAAFAGGAAYGVLGMNPARYREARILFWIAGLSVGAMAILFGITVPVPPLARIVGTGLIGALAAIILVESSRWINKLQGVPAGTLFLECSLGVPPSTWPSSGRIYAAPGMGINDPNQPGGGGFAQFFGPAGTDMGSWWRELKIHFIHRCELTNYGSSPIFNVTLPIELEFLQAIKQENGAANSGPVIARKFWPVEIAKVDPGRENGFAFYLFHIGPQFVRVLLPNEATFLRAGGDRPESTRVVKSRMIDPILNPRLE
jgi:hypothetical protein